MTELEFKNRTKDIALRVIRLVETLPSSHSAQIIGKQLLRSATSVGANYRAACRGKSTADVLHKMAIVEEEADEAIYWLELLIESDIVSEKKLSVLVNDINEIVAMTVSSIKTLRSNRNGESKIQNLKSKI
ncbi:MAG: four helix bundle protein [Pyrinomonadaceae bacterium]|nr:four helix bundle protein [Blastocatellia bacterium]MDQ3220302.1 four helix bundle protein [Acidobacteriota bacterium]MDQ3489846.1 four helix bundle protein [Acidobacteriota bacterium]